MRQIKFFSSLMAEVAGVVPGPHLLAEAEAAEPALQVPQAAEAPQRQSPQEMVAHPMAQVMLVNL
jgi:hypothetical protein